MKAATGNAVLMSIITVFLCAVLILLVTSISYTKAFRVKNRIINIIEHYDGDFSDDTISDEINTTLREIGYRYNIIGSTCPDLEDATGETHHGNDYLYCIYAYDSNRGNYYKVIAYMYFDLPFVGNYINIPVYGETRVFDS